MDNQTVEHKHQFLDYKEEYLKCPCGLYSDEKGSGKPAATANEYGVKDEAKRLNDLDGERRIQELKKAEGQYPSRPTAPVGHEDGSQAEGKGAKQPTAGTMTGSPKDEIKGFDKAPKDDTKK